MPEATEEPLSARANRRSAGPVGRPGLPLVPGDRLQMTRIQGVAGCRIRPCNASWPVGAGSAAIRRPCGWSPARQGKWRNTSGAWATEDAEGVRRRVVWALIVVLAHSRQASSGPPTARGKTDSRAGSGRAFFRRSPLSRHRQLPRRGRGGRRPASPAHPRFQEYSQHRGFIADPARVRQRTNHGLSVPSPTCGSASSRAAASRIWLT